MHCDGGAVDRSHGNREPVARDINETGSVVWYLVMKVLTLCGVVLFCVES